MAIYRFSFDTKYAGHSATVTDEAGTEVASSPTTLDAAGDAALDLTPFGNYRAQVSNVQGAFGDGYSVVFGVLDVAASLDDLSANGGVGAAETAYFVATGPAGTTDDSLTAATLTLEADARHGALPSWASVVDGNVALASDAGTCAYSFTGVADIDFAGTTAPTSAGQLFASATAVIDGTSGTTASRGDVGDGQDLQTAPATRLGGVISGASLGVTFAAYAYSDEGVTNIADGVTAPRAALTVTRIAQAAVIPD